MPWIDAGALKEKYADQLSVQRVFGYDAGFVAGILAALEMPTLSPPNEPLTLDELREMDGEPVWCEWLLDADRRIEYGAWFIVVVGEYGLELKKPLDFGCYVCKNENYGTEWLAYRRPPEGELKYDGRL